VVRARLPSVDVVVVPSVDGVSPSPDVVRSAEVDS
jgi:hypothetical protein